MNSAAIPSLIEQHFGHYVDVASRQLFCSEYCLCGGWRLRTYFPGRGCRRAHLAALYFDRGCVAVDEPSEKSDPCRMRTVRPRSLKNMYLLGEGSVFCNAVTEMVAADNSVLSHSGLNANRRVLQHFNAEYPAGTKCKCCVAFRFARWGIGAEQRASGSGRRRRRVPDQRLVPRRGPSAHR